MLTTGPVFLNEAPTVLLPPIPALVSWQAAPVGRFVTHPSAIVSPVPTPGLPYFLAGTNGSIVVANYVRHLQSAAPGIMSITSTTTGDLGEGALPPVIVLDYPMGGLPSAPAGLTTGPGDSGTAAGWPLAGESGYGQAPPTNSASTAETSNSSTSLPVARHVVVDGSMDGPHGLVTVQIPIGPMTQAVGLSVHGSSVSGPLPMVAQMSVIDRDGETLAQLGPLWNPETHQPADDVTIALNGAPMGGSLLVQLSAPSNRAAGVGSSSMGSSDAADGILPFAMDVQRLDSAPASPIVGTAASVGGVAIAGAAIGALPQNENHQNEGATGSPAAVGAGPAEGEAGASGPAVASDPVGLTSRAYESSDGQVSPSDFSGRIPTGPLAARSAAPLGPNLATVLLDEAPAVDRHERALSQEILASDDGQDSPGRKSLPDHPDARSTRPGETDEPEEIPNADATHVAVVGLGALPIKVSPGAGGDRTIDLDALLAALSGPAADRNRSELVEADGQASHQFLAALAAPASGDHERRQSPDYLTSACVLALGMGLVSRPLIPDLLRLIPSRSSRWRIVPSSAGRLSRGAGSRDQGFGYWPRRSV